LVAALVALAQAAGPRGLHAQDSPAASLQEEQAAFEELLINAIEADSVARWARGLAAEPHVAGTAGQIATRDSVLAWHREAGIEATYDSLILYMPQPLGASLEQIAPTRAVFTLEELALAEGSQVSVPPFNAYSGVGSVEGQLVYANYGLPADYAVLDSLGIQVRGRIVLVRYGRSFRGIKAREAEARGAAGLLLYSDPAADGFGRGVVLPDGPMRPATGIQRGSVLNTDGDPSTPDGPSLPGAARIPEAEMEGVAGIPVLPIGYGVAGQLLEGLHGAAPPEDWQGGLDLDYLTGPGPTAVRMRVSAERGEAAYHAAFNTIAAIPGSVWPDEWILVGAHRDAWGPGAVDNVSGTASVVEAARAFAAAAREGYRPRRTLVFATWDAEEWGVLGSTEWVEANADQLRAHAIAYVNQDSPVSGTRFGASAAPEIRRLVRDATRVVRDPKSGRFVYDVWLEAQRARQDGASMEEPTLGTMGGGSDHLPFYLHLGIPVAGHGFGGPSGVYHSMYDTADWMQRFGDPGYQYHAATARITAVILARLANAELIPYGHEALATAFRTNLAGVAGELERDVAAGSISAEAEAEVTEALEAAREALGGYEEAASRYEAGRATWDGRELPSSDLTARANRAQRDAIAALLRSTDEGGGWSRNLYVQDDPDNGYSPVLLPGVRLALRAGDLGLAGRELRLLAAHFGQAASALGRALALLSEEGP
jgi:N-acetylated-alpha-linked acidic dipeptidase